MQQKEKKNQLPELMKILIRVGSDVVYLHVYLQFLS